MSLSLSMSRKVRRVQMFVKFRFASGPILILFTAVIVCLSAVKIVRHIEDCFFSQVEHSAAL